jgi:AcrR family transcriptional regulator
MRLGYLLTFNAWKRPFVPSERVDLARIIRSASSLANRHGIEGLSMNELAQALKIRTPSLYSHVEGIDDVKRLLALHGLADLDRAATRATIGLSGPDAVRALLRAYRAFAEENPGVYAATVPTPPRSDREWSGAVDRLMATFITAMQGYGLRGPDIVHALRGLRSLVHGFVSLESEGALKHPVSRDESFAWLTESFLAALEKMSASRGKQGGRK